MSLLFSAITNCSCWTKRYFTGVITSYVTLLQTKSKSLGRRCSSATRTTSQKRPCRRCSFSRCSTVPECSAQRYTCSGESACQEGRGPRTHLAPPDQHLTHSRMRMGNKVPEYLAEIGVGVGVCVSLCVCVCVCVAIYLYWTSLVAEMVMNLPAMQETRV